MSATSLQARHRAASLAVVMFLVAVGTITCALVRSTGSADPALDASLVGDIQDTHLGTYLVDFLSASPQDVDVVGLGDHQQIVVHYVGGDGQPAFSLVLAARPAGSLCSGIRRPSRCSSTPTTRFNSLEDHSAAAAVHDDTLVIIALKDADPPLEQAALLAAQHATRVSPSQLAAAIGSSDARRRYRSR